MRQTSEVNETSLGQHATRALFPCALVSGLRSVVFVVAMFAIPQSASGIGQVKTELYPMGNFEDIDIINTANDVRGPILLPRQLALVGSPLWYGGNSVGAWSEHRLGIREQGKTILHRFRLVFPNQSDVLKPLYPFQSIRIGFGRVSDGDYGGFDIESWSLAGIMKEQVVSESWAEGRIAVISNRHRTDQFNPRSLIRLEKGSRISQLPVHVNQLAVINDESPDGDRAQNNLTPEKYELKSVGFAGKLTGLVLMLLGLACAIIGHWGLVWVDDWNWHRRTVFGIVGWGLAFIFYWYGLPILLGHLAWISPLPLGVFRCWLQW